VAESGLSSTCGSVAAGSGGGGGVVVVIVEWLVARSYDVVEGNDTPLTALSLRNCNP
jgi:hypothetical protein